MEGSSPPFTRVIYADQALLVVDKPAGLLSLPDGYDRSLPYLAAILQAEYGRLWVVHRLDRETSGVMILARTAEAHRALSLQFESRRVEKTYHAIVVGSPQWESRTIDLPLRVNGDRMHRTVVDSPGGKPAGTSVRRLKQFEGFALVEARPQTGYTHQIRAHLAAVGFPLAGDVLYNRRQVPQAQLFIPGLTRIALHAGTLSFNHPSSGERLTFVAPYPVDFQAGLDYLRT